MLYICYYTLLSINDLEIGLKKFNEGHFNYVFAATDYSAPIFRSFEYSKDEGLRMFFPENYNKGLRICLLHTMMQVNFIGAHWMLGLKKKKHLIIILILLFFLDGEFKISIQFQIGNEQNL